MRSLPDSRIAEVQELLTATPYRLVEFLGRGAIGELFVIEHPFLGRKFALKVLNRQYCAEAHVVDRLRIEAQATARLEHPNIVEMIDFWISDRGIPCVVMELLQGRNLAEELATRRRLPVAEAVDLACEALSGLSVAHATGIVHRDIKPENLFLHEVVDYGRLLKIVDFGLARVLPGASERAPQALELATRTGTAVGSPRFMSPEALRGERLDHRTDVYALGLVLYEMLVGRGPHDGGSWVARPPSHNAGTAIPEGLDAVVLRALHERRQERYQSAREFLADLQPFAGGTAHRVALG
jgi:eukaryotic-like serine/threonine-protein kinase